MTTRPTQPHAWRRLRRERHYTINGVLQPMHTTTAPLAVEPAPPAEALDPRFLGNVIPSVCRLCANRLFHVEPVQPNAWEKRYLAASTPCILAGHTDETGCWCAWCASAALSWAMRHGLKAVAE